MTPIWHILNGIPHTGPIAPSRVLVGDGTVAAPSVSFVGFPDMGLRATTNVLRMVVAGADVATVNSTGKLSVGSIALDVANEDVTLSRSAAGTLALNVATATPAGGSTAMRLVFGSTAGFGIYIGSGVPTVAAAQGSLYLRSDGSSTSTRAYINTNGNTTWTAITTAA